MLYQNDIFELDGLRLRLLYVERSRNRAWAIDMKSERLNTIVLPLKALANVTPEQMTIEEDPIFRQPSMAMKEARNRALASLGDLIHKLPEVLERRKRGSLIQEQAKRAGCSVPSIYKYLGQYLRSGQNPASLLSSHCNCGRTGPGLSGLRGAPKRTGAPKFQLREVDIKAFKDITETVYLKDARQTLANTYNQLLLNNYSVADGNGDMMLAPEGTYPTRRQLEHFIRKNYPVHVRLRGRAGDKDFELEHRAILGTVMAKCDGVGHQYEADGTIADVFLVAHENVNVIIGKPTIYLIIDRKSRLVVGWYVGLENPSWVCAMLAILSISADKRLLCERLGVSYDPSDWPAHQVFPREFLADRSELLTKNSDRITEDLGVTVTTVPSKRGDWKPVIESHFKLQRVTLQDGTPGFDPPENAKKRQGKHYEKDACLTLTDFEKLILLGIIKHNRSPQRSYKLSLRELGDGVSPNPIDLWNHNIAAQAGRLKRFTEERVRLSLLSRGEAKVTEHGIEFNGCFYSCASAIQEGWFVTGRRSRFKVEVYYDRRYIDSIKVVHPTESGRVEDAQLTPRSEMYSGMSFVEVIALQRMQSVHIANNEHRRLEEIHEYKLKAAEIQKVAKSKLLAAERVARSARKADTREARQEELRVERQQSTRHDRLEPVATDNVVALRPTSPVAEPPVKSSIALVNDVFQAMKERMLNGKAD